MDTRQDICFSVRKTISVSFDNGSTYIGDGIPGKTTSHPIIKSRTPNVKPDVLSAQEYSYFWQVAAKSNTMDKIRDCFVKSTQELCFGLNNNTLSEKDKSVIMNFLCERGVMQMSVTSELEDGALPSPMRQQPLLDNQSAITSLEIPSANESPAYIDQQNQPMCTKPEVRSTKESAPSVVHHDGETFSIVPEAEWPSPEGDIHLSSTDTVQPIKTSTQAMQPIRLKFDKKRLLKYDCVKRGLKNRMKACRREKPEMDRNLEQASPETERRKFLEVDQFQSHADTSEVDVRFQESVSYPGQSSFTHVKDDEGTKIKIKSENPDQLEINPAIAMESPNQYLHTSQYVTQRAAEYEQRPYCEMSDIQDLPERAPNSEQQPYCEMSDIQDLPVRAPDSEQQPYCEISDVQTASQGNTDKSNEEYVIAVDERRFQLNTNPASNRVTASSMSNRRHMCPICHKTFSTKTNLVVHQNIHTGVKHTCHICNKTFSWKTNLVAHQNVHTGVRPHQCDVCQKRFATKTKLRIHIRIHTGERPHCCPYCGKTFNTKSNYNTHVKIHTGTSAMRCAPCGQQFTHKSRYLKHMEKHNIAGQPGELQ